MMGAHHASTGAALGIAVAGTSGLALGLVEGVSAPEVIAVTLMTAGAALLPDIDHHNGSIANSLPGFGPFPGPTEVLCRIIGRLSGGHRRGTHSLFGIAVFVLLTWLIGQFTVTIAGVELALGAGLLGVVLAAFAFDALRISRLGRVWPWLLALAAGAYLALQFPTAGWVLPLAVGMGCAVHIVGDMITTGGVPLLWPLVIRPPRALSRIPGLNAVWRRTGLFSVPLLGNTGSAREWVLGSLVGVYVVAAVIAELGGLRDVLTDLLARSG
ncbi:metal-dependent hydrolase [Brevibacterium album]|uniref:metal-dependent hydrolase n=1 Tax=Brevibacterium album TaxID=417948 RepID=UPI00041BBA80|nr:metal-dependent hydrolase [Brevibacterium album]